MGMYTHCWSENIKLRNQHKNVLLLEALLESLAEKSAKLPLSSRLNESVIDRPLLKISVRQNMIKHLRKRHKKVSRFSPSTDYY